MLKKKLISLAAAAAMLFSTAAGAGATAPDYHETDGTVKVWESGMKTMVLLPDDADAGDVIKVSSSYEAGIAADKDSSDFLLDCGSNAGYEYLGTMTNGAKLQKIYDDMLNVCTKMWNNTTKNISSDQGYLVYGTVSNQGLSFYDAAKVYYTFRNDNPAFYFASMYAVGSGSEFWMVTDSDYQNGSVRAKVQDDIKKYVASVAAKAAGKTTAYDKAKAIHDVIVNGVEYAYDSNGYPSDEAWAHNIVGAIQKGSGVCEAYARTFQLMMNYLDVENYLVTGTAYNGYMTGDHAWNQIRMDDGKYYYVDCTWDDGWGYKYFACGTQTANTHKPSGPNGSATNFLIKLPTVSKTDFDPNNYTPAYAMGDVNGDGKIDITDVTTVIAHVRGVKLLTGDSLARANVDGKGGVDITDVTTLIAHVRGVKLIK